LKTLNKIAFLVEDFALQTPAQQLLDRFLIGFPRDGEFYRPEGCQIAIHLQDGADHSEIDRRVKDFGLRREQSIPAAVAQADGLVIVPKTSQIAPNTEWVEAALRGVPSGCCCFVYGGLSPTLSEAKKLASLASTQKVSLIAGTTLPVTWRLPEVDLSVGARLREALIVVQGTSPMAELGGLEGLLPVIQRRRGGESGIRSVRLLEGADLWQAGHDGIWSWSLLVSALSRSDTPQGDSVKDGRTQDLVGLGLVQTLARQPRGWVLEHFDGLRSSVLVLDGVVADFNFAVQTRDGPVISAQIYRPPAPAQHHFSRLAEVIDDFFVRRKPPWPIERNVLIAGVLETFSKSSANGGAALETPALKISYSYSRKSR
jgi:hypothetical protein